MLLDTSAYEDTEAAKPRTSPMHVAVQHGHVHLLDRLLKHGYSHLERTPDGKSTIHLAAGGCISGPKSAHGPSAVDRQLDCLLRMLDLKVDPMLLDSDGCSALHCAAGKSTVQICDPKECTVHFTGKNVLRMCVRLAASHNHVPRPVALLSTRFGWKLECTGVVCADSRPLGRQATLLM